MSIRMRDLLSRQDLPGEVISLRHALLNHPPQARSSLRRLSELQPVDGNGFARGCRRPREVMIEAGVGEKELGGVLPEWVSVTDNETRTVEGILTKSKITHEDFPLKPWHTYYDWNFFVRVDKQYTYLLNESYADEGIIECEWDTAFLPIWAWPQVGDRVWIVGRWIYDCGHPDEDGHVGHKTEIHPPKALVFFRTEPVQFNGNSGPTQANRAIVYISREGGYWRQPINDQNYAFDLYLPPQPYPDAEPRWTVQSQVGTLPVEPQITPYPARQPKALRVSIPLKGITPHPEQYGVIISGGWSDPRETEVTKINRFRVVVEKIFMDANLDLVTGDEWHVYIGINGRWKVWNNLNGDSETLDYIVDLNLHPEDRIHVTACGFEADQIHDLMGHKSGLSWTEISNHARAEQNAEAIRSAFLSLGGNLIEGEGVKNEAIGLFSSGPLPSQARPSRTEASDKDDYRLRYRIEAL